MTNLQCNLAKFYCEENTHSNWILALVYNYKKNLWSFMTYGEENSKIRLCNLAPYVLNWHFKIVKMSMVKCNAPILNKLKIMGFL